MAQLTVTKHFNAPPDKVFDLITDIPNAAERVSGIQKVEMLTEGPIGVGTRFRETRIMFKKEATEEMWFTAFERGKGYTIEAESCGTHYTSTFEVKPSGGGTDVSMTFDGKPVTLMSKLMMLPMGFFMKGMVRKCIEKDLDDLKAHVERASASA